MAEAQAGAEGTTTTGQDKPQDKKPDKPETQTQAKPGEGQQKPQDKSAGEKGAAPKRATLGADDDELPEGAELLELSPTALTKRLNRHSKAQLRKAFGTDDADEIKKKLEKLAELEASEEKRKQAEMSEVERERDLRTKAEQRAQEAEQAAKRERGQRIVERYDGKLQRTAERLLDEDHVGAELDRFARHLRDSFDEKALRRMTPEQTSEELKKFLGERIKAKPKIAKDYEERRREEIRAELKKEEKEGRKTQTVTNGAKLDKKDGEGGGSGEKKTFAPGKSNSMTDAEARAEMKRLGYSYR